MLLLKHEEKNNQTCREFTLVKRKNVWTVAKNAVEKGLTYAYRDRKVKKTLDLYGFNE